MIRYLLDTHTLLWLVADSPQLSPLARSLSSSPESRLSVSIVSLWEMGIKISRGKLHLGCSLADFLSQIQRAGVSICSLEPRHIEKLTTLPFHHNDPFDRALVAQCLTDEMVLIGADSLLDAYGVARRW